MSYGHPYHRPDPPELLIGSEFVTVTREKTQEQVARILRRENFDTGQPNALVLDRVVAEPNVVLNERVGKEMIEWHASGCFATELSRARPTVAEPEATEPDEEFVSESDASEDE